MTGEAWDDAVRDAVALVEAAAGGDPEGAEALVRNCDRGMVAVALVKLCTELLFESERGGGVCPGCWREWAEAIAKP